MVLTFIHRTMIMQCTYTLVEAFYFHLLTVEVNYREYFIYCNVVSFIKILFLCSFLFTAAFYCININMIVNFFLQQKNNQFYCNQNILFKDEQRIL